jgi:hypothetical protein
MLGEHLLEEAPEVGGGHEGPVRGAQGEEAVGIDRLQPHRHLACCGGHHAGQEERREIVRHHQAGVAGEGGEQPSARAGRRLDVGEIGDVRAVEPRRVLGHAGEDEAVDAVVGPGVAAAQRLQDHQRLPQPPGLVRGAFQGEIPPQAAGGDHPVEDEGALPHRLGVAGTEADVGDRSHRSATIPDPEPRPP